MAYLPSIFLRGTITRLRLVPFRSLHRSLGRVDYGHIGGCVLEPGLRILLSMGLDDRNILALNPLCVHEYLRASLLAHKKGDLRNIPSDLTHQIIHSNKSKIKIFSRGFGVLGFWGFGVLGGALSNKKEYRQVGVCQNRCLCLQKC